MVSTPKLSSWCKQADQLQLLRLHGSIREEKAELPPLSEKGRRCTDDFNYTSLAKPWSHLVALEAEKYDLFCVLISKLKFGGSKDFKVNSL